MRNPSRNPGGLTAHNRKSSQNPHLSSEQLLLFLDGELSSGETAQVKAHLEACWSCRVLSEQVGEVIADVVAYRDCLIKPSFPPTAGARAMFVTQLSQLVRSIGRPTLGSHMLGLLRALLTFLQGGIVPRHVWIGGIVITAFTLLLFTRFLEVPRVSASQFLANAQASEVRALDGVAKPVVYQKLRIRLGNRGVTRTIYRDLGGKRRLDYLDSVSGGQVANIGGAVQGTSSLSGSQVVDAELQQTFRTAHFNWEDPLSPTSYDAWHNSLSQKKDEVTQSSDEFLTLKTTTTDGPIKQASITVRTVDFHPVAEDLYLQDTHQVEVTELAWQIIPVEAINRAIFAGERAPSPIAVRPTVPVLSRPTEAELAEAELQARVAMHAENADLGEQIEFDRKTPNFASQRSLIVRGIVSTPERKDELSAALRAIPHVDLQMQTAEEAAKQEKQVVGDESESTATQQAETSDFTREQARQEPDAQGDRGPKPIPRDTAVGKLALEEQLEERFPNPQERVTFVNSAVELAQDCLAQAWALRRLGDRYTPEEVALLSQGSRQTLELLIHDHVSVLRQQLDSVRALVLQVLPPEPTKAVPPSPTPDAPPAAEPANDWRNAIAEIFPEVKSVEIDVAALFVGSGDTDGQARVRDLRLALAELETQLPVLYQRVSGLLSALKIDSSPIDSPNRPMATPAIAAQCVASEAAPGTCPNLQGSAQTSSLIGRGPLDLDFSFANYFETVRAGTDLAISRFS